MTVNATPSNVTYAGDGITTVFPIPFLVQKAEDVFAIVSSSTNTEGTELSLGSDYTIQNVGDQSGSQLTLATPLPGANLLYIDRSNIAVEQQSDYVQNDKFPAQTTENALDKLTMIAQQQGILLGKGIPELARVLMLGRADINGAGAYRGNNNRIQDVADPANDHDVVNREFLWSYVEQALAGVVGGAGFFQQSGSSTRQRTFQDKMRDAVNSADIVGIDPTGATDSTAGLATFLSRGGDLEIGPGNYLIAAAGADAGGVLVTLTASTRVTCSAEARFFSNGLDNDMIRFQVDADTPAGITFEWKGGLFDQTGQKNSTVIPFIVEYPPAHPGVSATCDALSIRGDTTVGGVPVSKVRLGIVHEVVTYAGDHWNIAGGDSGIFLSGCEEQRAFHNIGWGNRDLAIYASSDATGVLVCRTLIDSNAFINCFGGGAVKRSAGYAGIVNNYADNCVRAIQTDTLIGNGFVGLDMRGNKGSRSNVFIRMNKTSGFSVRDNHFNNLGAVLEDGTTIVSLNQTAYGIQTQGCTLGEVSGNTVDSLTTGAFAAFATSCDLIRCENYTDGTQSTKITWHSNKGNALRSAGQDTGDLNTFIDNVVFNALTSSTLTGFGTNVWEQRQNPTTNGRQFSQPMLFADGTKAAPGLGRSATSSIGLRAAANFLALTIANNDRFAASSTGVGFNDTAPIAKPALGTAPTDLATAITAITAIQTALKNYGLCN